MKLETQHDLNISDWGPYSKKFMGVSHLADKQNGIRFDLSLMPGIFRRVTAIPDVLTEAGYFPWEASADLNYYSHRHELEWKDKVYCDISFSRITDNTRLFRCEFVNNTDVPQELHIHTIASIEHPPLRPAEINLPSGAILLDALDFTELNFACPRHDDSLVYDGLRRGEIRAAGFTNNSGIGKGFGKDAGDNVTFSFTPNSDIEKPVMLVRYKLAEGGSLNCVISRFTDQQVTFKGGNDFQLANIPLPALKAGCNCNFTLTSESGSEIEIDCFVIVAADQAGQVKFTTCAWDDTPEFEETEDHSGVIISYKDVPQKYGIWWGDTPGLCRKLRTESLGDMLRYNRALCHHYMWPDFFIGKTGKFYMDILMQPIECKPNSTKVIYGMVCAGNEDEIKRTFSNAPSTEELKALYEAGRATKVNFPHTGHGREMLFGNERMAATTLTNVVYPIYTKQQYIRHSTPGRIFDCLYSWDSGFIGLGLSALDIQRAVENLNVYMTEPGDPEAAFIHHGTPAPVHHYLFQELWNRTGSKELLEHFYPRLKQYYDFLAGKRGSSNTADFKSNLLKTWDYFYNSGGWDDYPPQWEVFEKSLNDNVSPVITTAHATRAAKILLKMAEKLGNTADMEELRQDIDRLTGAIQTHTWDEEAGYFSYIVHNTAGEPEGFMRHSSGENFNRGMDGISPLIAGIGDDSQTERMLSHMRSDDELWTKIGLSTVDQSAPYYRNDGYWNGSVWMPYQWFFWKACLDANDSNLAWKIADTALQTWNNEVKTSYSCFEHFNIESRRGAGWYHFSALSAPVLNWFAAYYRPGTLTGGFELWIDRLDTDNTSTLEAEICMTGTPGRSGKIIAVLDTDKPCTVSYQGRELEAFARKPGIIEAAIPCDSNGLLKISVS